MPRHYVLGIIIALTSCPAIAQAHGHVTGIVLNENGQLVSGAKLCLMTKSENSTWSNCNLAQSDQGGSFDIPNVKEGSYHVFAVNEEEGYSLENQEPGKEVVVTSENEAPQVTLHLQTRGGILLASVSDKFTGQPLKEGWASYQDLSGKASGSSVIVNGKIRMAVPVDSDLVIIISSKGYKGWVFTDPSTPAWPVLRLHSGERKVLDVQIEPDSEVHN